MIRTKFDTGKKQSRLRKFNLDKFFIDFEKRFHRNSCAACPVLTKTINGTKRTKYMRKTSEKIVKNSRESVVKHFDFARQLLYNSIYDL